MSPARARAAIPVIPVTIQAILKAGSTPRMPVVMATPARRRRTNVQRWRACWRRYAANSASVCVGLTGGSGGSITPDSRVVRTIDILDVSHLTVLHGTEKNELRVRRRGGGFARSGRSQPVRRIHQFGARVFEKLELMVKMIDRADSPALSDPPQEAGGEDHNPQYGYQNQQDHY